MKNIGDPIEIGTDRQLFLDPLFLEDSDGVELRMNSPVQEQSPVLVADKPWEDALIRYHTVMREKDRFRMWYGVRSQDEGRSKMPLCYAESADGIRWEKPALGVTQYRGSKENNIVAPPSLHASQQGGSVFRDEHGPAEERYKLWTKYMASEEDREQGISTGLWAMVSPDGIRWSLCDEGYPLRRGNAADSQSICFWDEDLEKYVGFVRVKKFPEGRERTCSVGLMTSDDFRNWTQAKIVFAADEKDEKAPVPGGAPSWRPPLDFYVPGGMKVPGVPNAYIILPNAYFHWRKDGEKDAFPSTLDVRIATSRDLETWWQPPEREPFLRLGPDGSASAGMILANPWLIPVGDEIWIYYAGIGADHRGKQGDPMKSGIFRARLRRDGFIYANAPYGGGEFTTPVVTFEGRHLAINMDGSAGGWLQVELLTPEGHPISGYDLRSCETIRGNSVEKVVTWEGEKDLSQLAGQPVRLRFVMRSMRLFAFQFSQ